MELLTANKQLIKYKYCAHVIDVLGILDETFEKLTGVEILKSIK